MNAFAFSPVLAAQLLELNPGLTLWTAITFIILILVLARFAFGPILKMLNERERTIRETIEQAKNERAETEKLLAEQKEAVAAARREAAERAKKSLQEVEMLRSELTARAKREADELIATARRQIQEEKAKVFDELRHQVADMAVDAASRIIQVGLDDKAQRGLAEEYLRQFPGGRS